MARTASLTWWWGGRHPLGRAQGYLSRHRACVPVLLRVADGHGVRTLGSASEPLDHAALAAALARSLRAAGLPDPQVHVRQVPDIARHPETGKARRFIPL